MAHLNHDRYIVRMPDGLRDEIKTTADKNSRTMNAEIVHRLQNIPTLREYAAVHIMAGLSAERSHQVAEMISARSVELADALIAELEKTK